MWCTWHGQCTSLSKSLQHKRVLSNSWHEVYKCKFVKQYRWLSVVCATSSYPANHVSIKNQNYTSCYRYLSGESGYHQETRTKFNKVTTKCWTKKYFLIQKMGKKPLSSFKVSLLEPLNSFFYKSNKFLLTPDTPTWYTHHMAQMYSHQRPLQEARNVP